MVFICYTSIGQVGKNVFVGGTEGYKCYRIPTIIKSKKGTLLAFAEGRKNNCSDSGDIDIVLKKSYDNGNTWSELMIVWSDGSNTCGNPSPVIDNKTGDIILLSTWNLGIDNETQIVNGISKDTRRVYLARSTDEGQIWSTPNEITSAVKKSNWTWYATGPCNGIQINNGSYKGRIIIPCDHIEAISKKMYSHVIYSDDGGISWTLGGRTLNDKVNESTIIELPKNRLMLNMRYYGSDNRYRQVSISNDGGKSWSEIKEDKLLIEPICQASLLRHGKYLVVFSNPANEKARNSMTIKLSRDFGKTWTFQCLVYKGPSAYSNLVSLSNGNLGCLFEMGVYAPYDKIVFKEIGFADFENL